MGPAIYQAIEICASLHKNDIAEVIECLPQFIASTNSVIKILNIHYNRQSVRKISFYIEKFSAAQET